MRAHAEAHVVVDGSNVARSSAWTALHGALDDLERLRRFEDAALGWAATDGTRVTIVFDGVGPRRDVGRSVVLHGGSRTADEVIIDVVGAESCSEVVTDDRELAELVGDVVVTSSARFVVKLAGADGGGSHAQDAVEGSGATWADEPRGEVSGRLPDDVRARLERLRRGIE